MRYLRNGIEKLRISLSGNCRKCRAVLLRDARPLRLGCISINLIIFALFLIRPCVRGFTCGPFNQREQLPLPVT